MQEHTRIYLEELRFTDTDWLPCEIPSCGKQATDIHHIKARGMGGTKKKDRLLNLMALCRECHEKYGDKKQFYQFLIEIHYRYCMDRLTKLIEQKKKDHGIK